MAEKSRVPWLSIVLTGLLAFVISFIATGAVVAAYALALGMQAQGAPDPTKIAAFANGVIPILAPALLSLLVILAARRVVRRAKAPQLWHGVLVGVVAALPTLILLDGPSLGDLVSLLLPPASGLPGAYWGMTRSNRRAEEI